MDQYLTKKWWDRFLLQIHNIRESGLTMPATGSGLMEHIKYHKDGSIWARGQTLDGIPVGYWEWFRKDGVLMRSGTFENGEQTGEWITYDRNGQVYRRTVIKQKLKQD
jgi:antitoxin component YwqK of YwqJK toxin-antitoxin module